MLRIDVGEDASPFVRGFGGHVELKGKIGRHKLHAELSRAAKVRKSERETRDHIPVDGIFRCKL